MSKNIIDYAKDNYLVLREYNFFERLIRLFMPTGKAIIFDDLDEAKKYVKKHNKSVLFEIKKHIVIGGLDG